MITATVIAPSSSSFSTLMANPLLAGKQLKEGLHFFNKDFIEDMLKEGESTIITNPKGERLITSPVKYWEFITQGELTFGVIVTWNSIYKVKVL